ncbi:MULTISPECIES: hypothetical protein [Gordonia]|nr:MULTISPECIES: hypothetical protein [Gordonia]AUH68786.1 hypothetical protein CXX93_10965 [Gordonia sp. YC-JH1]KJR09262.1 hypothetical protein UG54_05210 [Gordonia sihwensis]KXT58082.1 hypothetical protein Y710_05770 [Gordonia sp. QH-12]MBY4571388.1 hypothetical protein [Gordonia sihwensis]WFN91348.1 hypothetical protein P5P27_11170 [Gordonia sihwensis]
MTTLIRQAPQPATVHRAVQVPVFGVPWPLYKLAAVVAGVVVAALVFTFTGSGTASMWASAVAVITVWWGGYVLLRERWDDGERDFIAEHHSRR